MEIHLFWFNDEQWAKIAPCLRQTSRGLAVMTIGWSWAGSCICWRSAAAEWIGRGSMASTRRSTSFRPLERAGHLAEDLSWNGTAAGAIVTAEKVHSSEFIGWTQGLRWLWWSIRTEIDWVQLALLSYKLKPQRAPAVRSFSCLPSEYARTGKAAIGAFIERLWKPSKQ